MKEYNISPRTGVCNTTQRALEEGEEFYAVLFDVSEGFERRDYCLAAWQGPPEGFFCYFKSRVPQKEEKKRRFVDTDILHESNEIEMIAATLALAEAIPATLVRAHRNFCCARAMMNRAGAAKFTI